MPAAGVLTTTDDDLLRRFTESAGTQDRVPVPTPPFHSWFAERREANSYRVTRVPFGDLSRWRLQPETGILVKEFNGVLHCLMTQLSPALQGTRSNCTRVHNGKPIPCLEYFTAPWRGRVLVDVLQSEHGAWFCWLTPAQLRELLHVDNLVTMDARKVLSGIPFAAPVDRPSMLDEDSFRGPLLRSLVERKGALHELPPVLTDGKYFTVIGVDVRASNREVAHWTQPMPAPVDRGLLAFLAKRVGDVLHVLVQARTQAGASITRRTATRSSRSATTSRSRFRRTSSG